MRFASLLSALTQMPVQRARRVYDEESVVMFGPVEPVLSVSEQDVAGKGGPIRVRIYEPEHSAKNATLVYFHGGGWVVGSLDSHDGVARHLCHFGGCRVVSAAYRLAPEHRFPAAVEDACAVTEWCTRSAGGPMFIGGDSAGGNLAAVVALKARDGGPRIDCQLLVYPVLECAATSRSAEYSYWVDQYLSQPSDADRVDASPLRAGDLRGLPPTLLLSCEGDPLVPQAIEYAQRLRDAGVRTEHIVYPGLIHGAFRMPGVAPASRTMLDAAAEAVRRA